MGAGNVKAVYARWYRLPNLPFRVLGYMAVVSKDTDSTPRYYGGWEALALAAGRMVPPPSDDPDIKRQRRAALKAVNEAVKVLIDHGAVTVTAAAAPGRNTTFALNLTAATVHAHREPSGNGTDDDGESNGSRSADTTVHAQPTNGSRSPCTTVHAHREPEEYEEQVRTKPKEKEADLRTAVTGPRTREAATDQISLDDETTEPAPAGGCGTHGPAFTAGTRADGRPACPLCRAAGRPRTPPAAGGAIVIPLPTRSAS